MEQEIQLKYINNSLQIGLVSWREAHLLVPVIEQLVVEVHKGKLIYRSRGSSKRISCSILKKGLEKTNRNIRISQPD